MARVLILYAHPGQRHSQVNTGLVKAALNVRDITFVDLYARYPRFKIDIDAEQRQLQEHDIIVLQFPLFWYSAPALIKEWLDLVLEYGWAYGPEGQQLAGKSCMLAVTCGASATAYSTQGQATELRTLLSPFEQTVRFCQMTFLPPYVLYASTSALNDGMLDAHVMGYQTLLTALRDERLDTRQLGYIQELSFDNLPVLPEA